MLITTTVLITAIYLYYLCIGYLKNIKQRFSNSSLIWDADLFLLGYMFQEEY